MYSRPINIFEMTICVQADYQANMYSNTGSNGTNREYRRKQALSNGFLTDAFSGNILKHGFVTLLRTNFISSGVELCPGCAAGSSLKVGALANHPRWNEVKISKVLRCGICDATGLFVPGKNETFVQGENETKVGKGDGREGMWKSSPINYSFALALPDSFAETDQPFTRSGGSKEEGQMIIRGRVGSGRYALIIRYSAVSLGMDSKTGQLLITDQAERIKRHECILTALKDQFLSPRGARIATIFPQISGIKGVISITRDKGEGTIAEQAPTWSPLNEDFISVLEKLVGNKEDCFVFNNINEFNEIMKKLISSSEPAIPRLINRGDWFENE